MANDTKSLVNCVEHRELGLIDLECIVLKLCQIKQIHHQVVHYLRGIQRGLQCVEAVINTLTLLQHTGAHFSKLLIDKNLLRSTHLLLAVDGII